MNRKRLGLVLAALVGAGGMSVGTACTSFGSTDTPDAGSGEGDVAVGDASGACTFPATPPNPGDDSPSCACPADKIFTGTLLDDAVVSGGKVYGRTEALNIVAGPVAAVTPPIAFAVGSPAGDSLGMFVDAKLLYVATTTAIRTYALVAPGTTQSLMPTGASFENVVFGNTVFYEWNATAISKRNLDGTSVKTQTAPVTAVAVDGDKAYFTVSPSAGTDAIAPFDDPTPVGRFPDPVMAIAVQDGIAYGATVTSSTVISRVALSSAAGQATTLLREFGLVSRLAINDGRLYWLSRRGGGAGVVLASSDLCGADYRLLATNLPEPAIGLSFDPTYVYVAGHGEALRQVPKKKP